jgi:hypothetical protein
VEAGPVMEANFVFVPSDRMGYGRMGVRLSEALEAKGVKLRGHPDVDGPSNVASWAAIPSHAQGWYEDQYTSILTMWEATRLPEAFRETMDEFDQILVPSAQNLELFSQYHPNVTQIRLGFDPEVWKFQKRMEPQREFVFLIGGSGARKGLDLVVKAYNRLWREEGSWGDGPTPIVWFKSPTGVIADMDGNVVPHNMDRMKIIGGRLTNQEEIDLYSLAHCYVQPSRGEGFGLQPLQAIAQGCPTILTDAHGHAGYAHLGLGVGTTMAKTAKFMHGDAGEWWEPNLDELCDRMRWVYEHYTTACYFAAMNSRKAHSAWTWAHSAQDWIDAHDGLLTPYAGRMDWHTPELRLYQMKSRQEWKPNIGGTDYHFLPDETYWVSGDVKRLAFERGDILHLDSMSEEGLTAEQVAELGGRRADANYCPSCHQRLNSGKTKADDLYEAMG